MASEIHIAPITNAANHQLEDTVQKTHEDEILKQKEYIAAQLAALRAEQDQLEQAQREHLKKIAELETSEKLEPAQAELLEKQREELEHQYNLINERTRKQFEAYNQQKQKQQKLDTVPLGAIIGVGVLEVSIRSDLYKKLQEANKVYTPVVNGFRSQVAGPANTPSRDQDLLKSRTATHDAQQALAQRNNQKMIQAIFVKYGIDQQTQQRTINNMREAQNQYQNTFSQQSPLQNPTSTNLVNQAIDTRLMLNHTVEKDALRAGIKPEVARQYSHEISTAFIVGQRISEKDYARSTEHQQTCKYLIDSQRRAQDGLTVGQKGLANQPSRTPGITNLQEENRKRLEELKEKKLKEKHEPTKVKKPEIDEKPKVQEPKVPTQDYSNGTAFINNQYADGTVDPNHIPLDQLGATAAHTAQQGNVGISANLNNGGTTAYVSSPTIDSALIDKDAKPRSHGIEPPTRELTPPGAPGSAKNKKQPGIL